VKCSRESRPEPTNRCLSPEQAKRFYDRFGSRQDWQAFYENAAVNDLIGHATFNSAHSVCEFGCGTGAFAARLLQRHLPSDARYRGLEISSTMVSLARKRLQPWWERSRVLQSNCSPHIDQPNRAFDRFVSTYVFDLLAPEFIVETLSEAHRLLTPGGKLCLASMTFGASAFSRAVTWTWQRLWRLNPVMVGGCRAIELLNYLRAQSWDVEYRAVVTSWGITSEIIVASAR
jgi:ubiquinone/menaquinone biosynthesis C-methylase UbiE